MLIIAYSGEKAIWLMRRGALAKIDASLGGGRAMMIQLSSTSVPDASES